MLQQVKRTTRDQAEQEVTEVPVEVRTGRADHAETDALLDEIDRVLEEATVDEVEAARREYRAKLESLTFGKAAKSGCGVTKFCALCTSSC